MSDSLTPATAHIHKSGEPKPEKEPFGFTLVTAVGKVEIVLWDYDRESALRRFRRMRAGK